MTPATLDATFSCKSNISSNECMLRSITPAFGRTEPGRHGCSLTDADDLADYLFQSRWAKGSGCSTRGGVRAWPIGSDSPVSCARSWPKELVCGGVRVWAKRDCCGISFGPLRAERGRECCEVVRGRALRPSRAGWPFAPGSTASGANGGGLANGVREADETAGRDAGSDTEAVFAGGSPLGGGKP